MKDVLMQFQGKCKNPPPEYVVDTIRKECQKKRIRHSELSPMLIRKLMRQCKLSAYYKYTMAVFEAISEKSCVVFNEMQMTTIMNRYEAMLSPYLNSTSVTTKRRLYPWKKKPNNMRCFFFLFKICQMEGYDEMLPFIVLPSANKVKEYQETYEEICRELGWTPIAMDPYAVRY
jgi:hypothetical protein